MLYFSSIVIIYIFFYILDWIITHNLIKGLKGLFEIYLWIILLILLLDYMYEYYINELNLVLIMLLMIGLLFDSRLSWIRKIIFVLILLLQLFIYKYLDVISIKILQDIFIYTAIVTISIIFHVFICEWLVILFRKIDYDYGVYLIVRVNILTSLASIHLLIQWIQAYMRAIRWGYYVDMLEETEEETEIRINKYSYFYVFVSFFNFICSLIMAITIMFQVRYINYVKLLFGENEKIKWKELYVQLKSNKIMIILFVLGIILSYIFETKRFYIMFMLIIMYKLYILLKELRKGTTIELNILSFNNAQKFIDFFNLLCEVILSTNWSFNKNGSIYCIYYEKNNIFYNEFQLILLHNYNNLLGFDDPWLRINPNTYLCYFIYSEDRVWFYSFLEYLNDSEAEDYHLESQGAADMIEFYKLGKEYTVESYCKKYYEYIEKWKPCCNYKKAEEGPEIRPQVWWEESYGIKDLLLLDFGFFVKKTYKILLRNSICRDDDR